MDIFNFSVLTGWIDNLLRSFMPGWLTVVTECLLIGLILLTAYAVLALFYIYFERNVKIIINYSRHLSSSRTCAPLVFRTGSSAQAYQSCGILGILDRYMSSRLLAAVSFLDALCARKSTYSKTGLRKSLDLSSAC